MPSYRRILSLWFPRIAVERVIRQEGIAPETVMAVLRDTGNMQVIDSLTPAAEAAGLRLGQPLRDAMAMCPDLVTRLGNPQQDAAFLATVQRWAGRFSPWISAEPPAGLIIDLTGCAHLFGGETALLSRIEEDCHTFGLSVQAGIADTVGAAWALARFSGQVSGALRNGDAIDQEARATRSRAAKRRHWERGGAAPKTHLASVCVARIAPRGKTRTALAKLPLAALRLAPEDVTALARLGLRRVEDLLGMPRAALSRRFGSAVLRRLDQALGLDPEPVSPARPADHFAVRLTLPEPIGLESDILAAIDRLLPPLCDKLSQKGRGLRKLRLQVFRTDETSQSIDVGLARPTAAPARIRPLLAMKLAEIDAGFGIDLVRLAVLISEPVQTHQHSGHMEAGRAVSDQLSANTALEDLIGRLGARVGLENITRVHPAESHIPEKSALTLAAAWSEPALEWAQPTVARPLVMVPPEPVFAPEDPFPPETFRWRGRTLRRVAATGPERIAPEWWLDDPHWRTGVRDYWRVETDSGARLWLYFAHGGTMSGGWFCQGEFA
ncbi:MAG: DNA polymerase Y family protein [Paracoccaceae bacterium]